MQLPSVFASQSAQAVLLLAGGVFAHAIRSTFRHRRAVAGVLIATFALASLRVLGVGRDAGANQVAVGHAISLGILLLGFGSVLVQLGRAWRLGELDGWRNGPANWVDPFPFGGLESDAPSAHADPTSLALLATHAVGALVALVAPHLHVLMLAVVISMVAGEFLERRLRALPPPVTLTLTLIATGVAWYFLALVAGGGHLALAALPEAPYSPAFELGASLLLGLVAYRLLGFWPLHGARQGPVSPLLGAILLVRLVLPVLPSGLGHWQPLLYLLLAVAVWHAALMRRPGEAAVTLAGLGLLSGDATAAWSGLVLVAGSGTLALVWQLKRIGRIRRVPGRRALRTAGVFGLPVLIPVLSGGLAVEVFYSVVVVSGAAVLLWRVDPREQPGHISGSSIRDSSG